MKLTLSCFDYQGILVNILEKRWISPSDAPIKLIESLMDQYVIIMKQAIVESKILYIPCGDRSNVTYDCNTCKFHNNENEMIYTELDYDKVEPLMNAIERLTNEYIDRQLQEQNYGTAEMMIRNAFNHD